ncbi:MAG TPA: cytochrome c3 family protein [Spirochaetota bacterium]|nr:cytochrome c3 family protein [Spirochaetota bacterium]
MPKPRDVVSITKVTKFALEADGITPMRSLVGTVKMSHRVHEEHGIGCETCHHKKGNDERSKTCAAAGCHTGAKGFRVMHGLCEDCHNARQPVREKCMRCH